MPLYLILQPLLVLMKTKAFKRFVVELMFKYVKQTDNTIDDHIAHAVKRALFPK